MNRSVSELITVGEGYTRKQMCAFAYPTSGLILLGATSDREVFMVVEAAGGSLFG